MKTLLYLTFSLCLLLGKTTYATKPAVGTTNFNALAAVNLLPATASPGTASNPGALGWDFTVTSPGGNVSIATATTGVGGASDICIRLNRSTAGFFVTSAATLSNDGSEFKLNHVYLKVNLFTGATADMILTGYRNHVALVGATKTITGITTNPTWTLFDVSAIAAFSNVDEFRFTQAGTSSAQISFVSIDEIDIAAAAPLPLTLTSFSALRQDNAVTLDWTTLMEQNTASFEIQRTENAANYLPVGTILAAGNSALPLNYEFKDDLPVPTASKYYYRLKMADLDGRFTYSPIVIIDVAASPFGLTAYPNPLVSSTTLMATSPVAGNAQLTVTDLAGRQLLLRPVYLQKGSNTLPLPFFGGLQKGIYVVRLVLHDQTETIRLLKTD